MSCPRRSTMIFKSRACCEELALLRRSNFAQLLRRVTIVSGSGQGQRLRTVLGIIDHALLRHFSGGTRVKCSPRSPGFSYGHGHSFPAGL